MVSLHSEVVVKGQTCFDIVAGWTTARVVNSWARPPNYRCPGATPGRWLSSPR